MIRNRHIVPTSVVQKDKVELYFKPKLYRHGEFSSPETVVFGAGKKINEKVVSTFDKRQAACARAHGFGSVSNVYLEVVQMQEAARTGQGRGLGLMFCAVTAGIIFWIAPILLEATVDVFRYEYYWEIPFMAAIYALLLFAVPFWLWSAWQMDMFAPDDEPTLFDRKRRKVYRLREAGPWRMSFKPVPLMAAEYDWDAITAEHRAELITTGQTVSRMHKLVLTAYERSAGRNGKPSGRLLERFNLGNGLAHGEQSVPMLWEHIRRYMEEGGPPLAAGDELAKDERPRNLWQSMGAVGPFGPKFFHWWRTPGLKGVTIFALVFLPFTLPFQTLWGVCNWMSHLTMRRGVWPPELVQLLGEPLSREEVYASRPVDPKARPAGEPAPQPSKGKRVVSRAFYAAAAACAVWAGYRWYQAAHVEADVVAYALGAIACFAFGAVIGQPDE